MATKQDLTKEERVTRERRRLKRLLRGLEPERKAVAERLADNIAFMVVLLEDLRHDVLEKGPTSVYQNGANQWGTKKSPEAELYIQLLQRFIPAVKQFMDLLPDESKAAVDPLLDYVGAR